VLPSNFLQVALGSLTWLKASVNAGTSATYKQIHNAKDGDFEKAIANLTAMVRHKQDHRLECTLGAQILLLEENYDEIETLAKICRDDIGLNYLVVKPYSQHLFSKTQRYREFGYQNFIAYGHSLSHLSTESFSLVFRGQAMQKSAEIQQYDKCLSTPFLLGYIMADGSVYGCMAFLLDDLFNYGNMNQNTFQEIWEGDARRKGFEYVSHELDISDCRINCRMDACNRYLDEIQQQSVSHMNFI
jgi:radical SAM protein with 4Fe4S-binding SPASM domain